jgi:hypothetical protein
VTGPLGQRRQRPRRRITPNANTSTTTMISTHNHVDMAASLVGAGAVQADATAAHPSEQPGSRPGDLPGPDRRPRSAPARGTPTPRDLPADLGWPGSRPRVGPGGAEPFGPRPASPAPTTAPSTTREEPGRRQPTPHDHSDPDWRVWRGRAAFALLGVGEQSKHGCADAQWQTPRRRRRTDGPRLRGNPNVRRGRLHRPALPVQPRSALRAAPRLGPAEGDSAAHPPARPRSWVTAQVGCWVSWPRLIMVGSLGRTPMLPLDLRRPQPQQGQAA